MTTHVPCIRTLQAVFATKVNIVRSERRLAR
jgi:hypothetical protein